MKCRYQKANAEITDYVQTVLVMEDLSNSGKPDLPLVTKGMPALLYHEKNDKHQITLFGRSVPDSIWTAAKNTTLIAFFFKPFVPGVIFKLSTKELKDKPIALDLWNAQKAMALKVQLLHSKSTGEIIEILNNFIYAQLRANQRDCEIIRHATDKLMQNSNAKTLTELPDELNLTERTFQRIFKKYTGITANEYRRICQFYFAFSQMKGGHFDRQTDIAYSNGYFDQSHFIRSFKEFTDTTPGAYLQNGLTPKTE
jgi:AraC-like DNA-binding protein